MSNVIVSADDPRGPKAIALVAGASQWLKCRDRAGRKAYGVPSSTSRGAYHLTTRSSCTCRDFQYRGAPCKHVLAVRLHVALVAEQRAETSRVVGAGKVQRGVIPASQIERED